VEAETARFSATYLVLISILLGYPDRARKRSDDILAAARRSADPAYIAHALVADAWANCVLGDPSKVQQRAEEVRAYPGNFPRLQLAFANLLRGWALAVQGQVEEGITDPRRPIPGLDRQGGFLGMIMSVLAEGYLASERVEEGLEAVSYGLSQGQETGQRFYEARLHHLKGELLLTQTSSNAEEAESCFLTAIEVARRQGAKLFELRATNSLARLLARQGRRDGARAMLAEIYGWFTEGFDTRDLKDAKALLAELTG
jgi:predicted ATPase